jgi:RNA polymerase sigma factor (sigma-70 family)
MTLEELLLGHRADLEAFVARHAGRLLRYETDQDLVQGIHLRALERGTDFRYQGEKQFYAWIYALARGYLADRHAHWGALRRRPKALLRLTQAGGSQGAPEPAGDDTGPETFADRREMLTLAVKALGLLPERDAQLVRWAADGISLEEIAGRLEMSYRGAQTASRRAQERFRKAFQVVAGP